MFDKTALRTGTTMMATNLTAVLAALVVIAKMGVIYAEISCEAPAVRSGDPAYIICLFDVDVSVTKKNIKVQRRSLTSARFDPDKTDAVLDCYWQNVADFSCQFGNGFKLVGEAGRTAVVRIASASKNDEQVYMCEVVPSDPTNIQTCTLAVRDPLSYDGNCSRERLEDDTAKVKGIVTAIIIIICVIVILVLVVLLVHFRVQLKDNLQRCPTRWSPTTAPPSQGGEDDPEDGTLLSSNDHAGDEGNATEDAKEKKKIDSYIRYLLTVNEAGGLDEFYSRMDERLGKSAKASSRKERPACLELQGLPKDPEGLHITVEEWHEREEAERNRKKEEADAQKELDDVKEKHRQQIQARKEKDRRKGITDPNKDPKRRTRREESEKKRREEENAALTNLKTIRERHVEERKKQAEADKLRLKKTLQGVKTDHRKRSASEEGTGTRLLKVHESARGGNRDTPI